MQNETTVKRVCLFTTVEFPVNDTSLTSAKPSYIICSALFESYSNMERIPRKGWRHVSYIYIGHLEYKRRELTDAYIYSPRTHMNISNYFTSGDSSFYCNSKVKTIFYIIFYNLHFYGISVRHNQLRIIWSWKFRSLKKFGNNWNNF